MTTRQRLCPICRKPRDHALKQRSGSAEKDPLKQRSGSAEENQFYPFCSARCRDKDLSQWFNDGYAVPGEPALPSEVDGLDGDNQ